MSHASSSVSPAMRSQLRDPRVPLADGPLVVGAASTAAAGTAAHFRLLLLLRVVRCLRALRRARLFRAIRITRHAGQPSCTRGRQTRTAPQPDAFRLRDRHKVLLGAVFIASSNQPHSRSRSSRV